MSWKQDIYPAEYYKESYCFSIRKKKFHLFNMQEHALDKLELLCPGAVVSFSWSFGSDEVVPAHFAAEVTVCDKLVPVLIDLSRPEYKELSFRDPNSTKNYFMIRGIEENKESEKN